VPASDGLHPTQTSSRVTSEGDGGLVWVGAGVAATRGMAAASPSQDDLRRLQYNVSVPPLADTLRLATWNILVPVFCDPALYPGVPPSVLAEAPRRAAIHRRLREMGPEVMMLQECARGELDLMLAPAGPLAGYGHMYCGVVEAARSYQGRPPQDWGAAIAWREVSILISIVHWWAARFDCNSPVWLSVSPVPRRHIEGAGARRLARAACATASS
jgi:hypothetical protein